MIILKYEGNTVEEIYTEDIRCGIKVLGMEVQLIRVRDVYHLRLPREIECCNKEIDDGVTTYTLVCHDLSARLVVYEMMTGYDIFRVYRLDHAVMIGSGGEIEIRDMKGTVRIDPTRRRIISMAAHMYINGVQYDEKELSNMDIIMILGRKIVFHDDFLTINTMPGTFVHLEPLLGQCEVDVVDRVKPVHENNRVLAPREGNVIALTLPPKPMIHEKEDKNIIFLILPGILMASAAMAVSLLTFAKRGEHWSFETVLPSVLMPLVMLVVAVVLMPLQYCMERFREHCKVKDAKKNYADHIEQLKHKAEEIAQERHMIRENVFLQPAVLLDRAKEGCVECLDLYDTDHYAIRIGVCAEKYIVPDLDHEIVQNDPLLLNISSGSCSVCIDETGQFRNAVLMSLFLSHRAADMAVAVICDGPVPFSADKVPHIQHVYDAAEYAGHSSHYDLVLCFGETIPVVGDEETVIVFSKHMYFEQRAGVVCAYESGKGIMWRRKEHKRVSFTPDLATNEDLEMAIAILAVGKRGPYMEKTASFLAMYGCRTGEDLMIRKRWENAVLEKGLKAVCGMDEEGRNIYLDMHDAADGPHGLLCGMTGSGKSEFLLTFLLSLAVEHSPRDLSIVLCDFKGGGLLQAFSSRGRMLPHLAGTLTNLDGYALDRALYALSVTCRNREMYFRKLHQATGKNIKDIDAYRAAWSKYCGLPYLGHMLIVVDEFAEMKKEQPDFMRELITIARVGRSLGIHLLLSTQTPGGIIDDQIRANVSFRICMKVKDEAEAREAIGRIGPEKIKSPGGFFLRTNQVYLFAQAAYCNCSYGRKIPSACYDNAGRHLYTVMQEERNRTEREKILDLLIRVADEMNNKATTLWQPLLEHVSWKQVYHYDGCGMIDDYRHQKWKPFVRRNTMVAYSSDPVEAKNFLEAMMYDILMRSQRGDEMYFLSAYDECICEDTDMFAGLVQPSEKERLLRLDRRIRSEHEGMMHILIDDPAVFCEEDSQWQNMLCHWMRNAERYHITVLVMIKTSHDLKFRTMSFVQTRLLLTCDDASDASSFLERRITQPLHGRYCGWLPDNEGVVKMLYPSVKKEYIGKFSGSNHGYTLWKMPSHICASKCNRVGIPIGIDEDSGEWITAQPAEGILTAWSDVKANDYVGRVLGITEAFSYVPWSEYKKGDHMGNALVLGPLPVVLMPMEWGCTTDLEDGHGLYIRAKKVRKVVLCDE